MYLSKHFNLIAACPACPPPAVERPNPDPSAPCPICAAWEVGPFGMVITKINVFF